MESLGKVHHRDSLNRPPSFLLECFLGKGETSQLYLHPGKLKKSIGARSGKYSGCSISFDLPDLHPVSDSGGGVDWGIVPVVSVDQAFGVKEGQGRLLCPSKCGP